MIKFLSISSALFFATMAHSLTPEELRAKLDERASEVISFQTLLNDPDPVRSRAAMELMIESGNPALIRTAVEFGLQSAVAETRLSAFRAFLNTRPTLLINLDIAKAEDESFESRFKESTGGSVLGGSIATYAINIGSFDAEKNCYVRSRQEKHCAIQIAPNGISAQKANSNFWTVSYLVLQEDGTLSGSTNVGRVDGGFPTTVRITP